MTQDQIDRATIANNQLVRTVFVALRCAGGTLTRGDIVNAFEPCSFRPTRGELSDAINTLAVRGWIDRIPGASGFYDSMDCVLKTR